MIELLNMFLNNIEKKDKSQFKNTFKLPIEYIENNIALKKNLKVISFGIKDQKSNISFKNIYRSGKYFLINIEYNNQKKSFLKLLIKFKFY